MRSLPTTARALTNSFQTLADAKAASQDKVRRPRHHGTTVYLQALEARRQGLYVRRNVK